MPENIVDFFVVYFKMRTTSAISIKIVTQSEKLLVCLNTFYQRWYLNLKTSTDKKPQFSRRDQDKTSFPRPTPTVFRNRKKHISHKNRAQHELDCVLITIVKQKQLVSEATEFGEITQNNRQYTPFNVIKVTISVPMESPMRLPMRE